MSAVLDRARAADQAGVAPRAGGMPTRGAIARRRRVIRATKFVLPAIALILLGAIALWPEIERLTDTSRVAFRRITHAVGGASLANPRYRGVDAHGRAFTVTAKTANQTSPEHVDLVSPQADVTLANGTWLSAQARAGVFTPHANQLDLSDNVFFYREDGMTLRTQALAIDLRGGAAANAVPVHIEGPLGSLDGAGMTLTDKGALTRFPGHASASFNAAHAAPLAASAAPVAGEPPPPAPLPSPSPKR